MGSQTPESRGILTPIIVLLIPLILFAVVAHFLNLRAAALGLFAVILSSVVPLVCLLRGAAADRQGEVFKSIQGTPVGETAHARVARQYFNSMRYGQLLRTPGFAVPAVFLTILVLLFALAALFGAEFQTLLKTPNLFLGGVLAAKGNSDEAMLTAYQGVTLLMISMAALGAYVIVVLRLVKRVNNFDIDPISFYFFSFHIIQAVVVAAVIRHLIPVVLGEQPVSMFAALGFAVGLQPDIFMTFVARWAREKLSVVGSPSQAEPAKELRPTNLSLSMLEGVTKDKRARLEEMNIENSQGLAEYNPYVLWCRTAYQMPQVLDWIAQAQLYVIVKEDGLHALRPLGIRDVFGFVSAAQGGAGKDVAKVLNMPVEVLAAIVDNLRADSSYVRLQEVRDALARVSTEQSDSEGDTSDP